MLIDTNDVMIYKVYNNKKLTSTSNCPKMNTNWSV